MDFVTDYETENLRNEVDPKVNSSEISVNYKNNHMLIKSNIQ